MSPAPDQAEPGAGAAGQSGLSDPQTPRGNNLPARTNANARREANVVATVPANVVANVVANFAANVVVRHVIRNLAVAESPLLPSPGGLGFS